MTGDSLWEDIRSTLNAPGLAVNAQYRPPLCGYCGKRVRRWQRYGGWGGPRFTPKTADHVWHMKCMDELIN